MYDYLKIIHVLSATLILTGMSYSFYLWRRHGKEAAAKIQTMTWAGIIPLAILQLLTGFTMISLQHYDTSAYWIRVSMMGFLIAISSWIGFIYLFISERNRKLQKILLVTCALTLFIMIFFMANKI